MYGVAETDRDQGEVFIVDCIGSSATIENFELISDDGFPHGGICLGCEL